MRSALAATLLLAVLAAGCSSAATARRGDPAAPARAADDQALADAKEELAPLEDHFVAVAGGRFLGAAMLREDAVDFLGEEPGADAHAYLFIRGTEGERAVAMPALYGPRVAGNGLLQALGLKSTYDPETGVLTLSRGERKRTFTTAGGAAIAEFTVQGASGLGPPLRVEFVLASGFAGTALLAKEDGEAAALSRSEIPGVATVTELMSGRTVPCRRALCWVTLEGFDDDPGDRVFTVVEVLFPR